MQIVVIADAYPPMRTSAAVQLRDLVAELANQGHFVTVLLPDSSISAKCQLEKAGTIEVLRLKAPKTKDVNYIRRAVGEYFLSFFIYRHLKSSPLKDRKWEGLVWYSPSIFFGSLVRKVKAESNCRSYLILRDIFPEWAVDMGLLSKGIVYRYFKKVERHQYEQADTIGVQTPSNCDYFDGVQQGIGASIEVLNNWLSESTPGPCSISVADTSLAGRTLFVYTGNIGIAQGMDILIDLASALKNDETTGFIFVGRGTALDQIKKRAAKYALTNILFFDEIDPGEIPGLLAQCHVGLIALDSRHKNDNIPGKFLAYMQAGLPVLANINAGNDLEKLVVEHRVGAVVSDNSLPRLTSCARKMLEQIGKDESFNQRCRHLSAKQFSSTAAVKQIVAALAFNSPGRP